MTLQNELQNELSALKNSYASLELNNKELSNTIAQLQERNRVLNDDLNRAMFASVDQSQIEAHRKSDKLTVRAKRTKKLIANFQVPSNLKNLSFRIIDPQGSALTSQDGTIASNIIPSVESYTASSETEASGSNLQKVEMIFSPSDKLKSGVYTVEILNENLYVSSMKVKLK